MDDLEVDVSFSIAQVEMTQNLGWQGTKQVVP